jgi:hypothetical protein
MSRQRFKFWLDDDLREGLRAVRDRDGILDSEQVRRAVKAWLEKKGITDTRLSGRVPGRPSARPARRQMT